MFQCYNPVLSALEIEGVETVTEETSLLVLYAELDALIRQFTPTDVPSFVTLIRDREALCRYAFNINVHKTDVNTIDFFGIFTL